MGILKVGRDTAYAILYGRDVTQSTHEIYQRTYTSIEPRLYVEQRTAQETAYPEKFVFLGIRIWYNDAIARERWRDARAG